MAPRRESPVFIGKKPGERLFGVYHAPDPGQPAPPAVVLCAPFAWEKVKAHRTLVTFARHLARQGIGALRFDFQGQGDSEGEFTGDTFERMTADTLRATRWVEAELGSERIALFGLRLGASVAAAAAARLERPAPLVMWEPVAGLHPYLYDYLRMNLADQSLQYGEVKESRDELVARIMRGEEVRVDGFVFSRALWEGARQVELSRILTEVDQPALLLQIDRGQRPKPPRRELRPLLAEQFEQRDDRTFEQVLCSSLFWLQFSFHRPHEERLFQASVEWLLDRWGAPAPGGGTGAAAPATPAPSRARRPAPGSTASPGHHPVTFEGQDGNRLWAIHHPGEGDGAGTCLILLNSGLLPRYCYHRHYVKLTRHLAPLGISVLRVDATGLGDSEGELAPARVEKHWHDIQRGLHVPDGLAAIHHAREALGARRILLGGACGGAATALLTAAAAPDAVAGCALIAMPVMFSDPEGDSEALHPFEAERMFQSYWRKLLKPRALLRLVSGRSDYRLIAESVYRAVRERARRLPVVGEGSLMGRGSPAAEADADAERPAGYNPYLEEAFSRYLGRGGDILLMMASIDKETADFEQHFQPRMLGPDSPHHARCRYVKVEGASHTFAESGKEELAFEEIERWIAARLRAEVSPLAARPRRRTSRGG